jgi:hypothetical protein
MTKSTIPYWRLRRFAPRSLAVLGRHAETEPIIGAYQGTLGISALTFKELYDRSLVTDGAQDVNHAQARELVGNLHRRLRGWASIVGSVITSLNASEYGDNPSVPDDVISDVEQFELHVTDWEASNQPLPFGDTMREDLAQARAQLEATMTTVGDAAAVRSSMTTELKEAALAFNRDLVAFRRSLAALFGTSHSDYQKLRAGKASTPDVDDDEVADDMPPAEEPSMEEALEDAVAEGSDAEEAAE